MNWFPSKSVWMSEMLRLRRQPVAAIALVLLLVLLLGASVNAGLKASEWRNSAANDERAYVEQLRLARGELQKVAEGSPAAAVATYQVGRSELGSTRMPVLGGLGLGVHRLDVLPVRLKVSMDSRLVDARDPGVLKNPLLDQSALPGLPAMVGLALPLVALVLCAGMIQEEREQGRLRLMRVQAIHGLRGVLFAGLGLRFTALWTVAVVASAPAFLLDRSFDTLAALQWAVWLAAFCGVWVVVGGALSILRISSAASILLGLGLWLLLTFAVPAVLVQAAKREYPMPSRLASIVAIRDAQQDAEEREQELSRLWYAAHPEVGPVLPSVWPASFVPRALEQDKLLHPTMKAFDDARLQQAALVRRWSWTSPGLALVLLGERLAGTDAVSHAQYVHRVDVFEERWRDFLVPHVMNRHGLSPKAVDGLPRFGRP